MLICIQAFVRLSNVKTKQEVIFTAEDDASMMYKFNLDVAESGREYFNQQSGKYTLDLIIGDAIVMNPFSWNLVRKIPALPKNGRVSNARWQQTYRVNFHCLHSSEHAHSSGFTQ